MYSYIGAVTGLTIVLHRGLYLANIMDRYGGPDTALNIALHLGFYLDIIMYR
jgi:hypothetical protein